MARTPYDPNDPNALPLDQQGIDPQASRDALTSQMDPGMGTVPTDTQGTPQPSPATATPAPTSTAPTAGRTQPPPDTPEAAAQRAQELAAQTSMAQLASANTTPTAQRPTGGSINDPNYLNSLISWAATQPGVNPSVVRDPNYWRSAVGRFNGDENYFVQRMFTPEGPAEGGAPAAAPSAPAGPAAPTASYQPVPQSSFNNGLRDFLMNQLHGLETPIDANNPELSPAISAYTTQSQRDQQAERDALAERYYASGPGGGSDLNSGGFNTAVQQGMENAAGKRANFSGSMVFQANQARRSQLQGMLSTAVQAGLTDQAQAIQQQIAELDAKLRQQGITNQSNQASDQLGLNYNQLIAQMNRDSMLGAMNG